jgi:hypothetical protein
MYAIVQKSKPAKIIVPSAIRRLADQLTKILVSKGISLTETPDVDQQ